MPEPLTAEEKKRFLVLLDKRKKFFRWAYFTPYPKQGEFLQLGATKRERLLMASNRTGKSEIGAFEATCHATGLYPPWWEGKRFDEPTKGWVCGVSQQQVRDVCQVKLCGPWGLSSGLGAGMIPKHHFLPDKPPTLGRGIPGIFDTIHVKHISGGISTIGIKSYEQGREKFQGEGLHWIWFDEEPSLEIYTEGITRLGELQGVAWMTFTPLLGPTEVVLRYTDEPSPGRAVVGMTLDDIPPGGHMSEEAKRELIESWPAYQREARARGIPMMGEGRVFTCTEESLLEPPLKYIPPYWTKIWGIDPGIGHPFGAVLILWDKDNDVMHVHHTIRMADALPMAHAFAMMKVGAAVPVAWPKDAGDREKSTGQPLSRQYKVHGLKMLDVHASWPDGSISTEAGIVEMDERMRRGGLKVARHLNEWFEEYRTYHRRDGKIVKLKDDLMSATRVAVMMKRYARPVQLGAVAGQAASREPQLCTGIDFDLFA